MNKKDFRLKSVVFILAVLFLHLLPVKVCAQSPTVQPRHDFIEGDIYYAKISGGVEVVRPVYQDYRLEWQYKSYSDSIIVIPESTSYGPVIGIDYSAFSGSRMLSVDIPNTVLYIRDDAFKNCKKMKSIVIPSSVLDIGWRIFAGCSSLESITVEAGNEVYDSRENCNAIVETYNNKLVSGCIGTKIPSTVTRIGIEAFAYQTRMKKIEIPQSVTEIGNNAFAYCDSLESVSLIGALTSIQDNVFYGCKSLKSVDLPNTVISVGSEAFYDCESLTSIDLPNSLTSIGNGAFYNCKSLVSIDLPNPVSSIGGRTFYNCESLVSLNLPNSLTSIGNGAFYNCKNLKTLDLPNGLTNIGADAFFQCKNLEITNFPNSLISIGARAFSACDSIREAVFSDKLKYVGNKAFYSCVSLKRVSFYSDSVNVGEGTFEGCYSLSDVVLPVEMDTIRNNLFSGCSSLEEITFPKKLKSVGNKAFYKSGIVSAILPEGTLRIGDYAFQYCSKLKTLFIPSTVTILAEYPFRYCPALESIKVAEGNPIFDSRDDCNALIRKEHTDTYTVNGQEYPGPTIWCGCDNTVIPSSVVSISGGAFCGNMTAVHIPQTVKLICGSAFVACEKLDSVFLYSEEPPHVNIYGGGGFSFPQSISVFVPRGTKDRYKATSWKGYRLIMEWSSSAIDEIEVDDALVDGEEPAEYYNLQGVRVVNPTNGVFIKKQGGKISKIVL